MDTTPEQPENPGAGGDDEYPLIGDTKAARLERKVIQNQIRQRIPVTREQIEGVIKRQVLDALDPKASRRERAAAARVVLQAIAINQADEHKNKPDRLEISMVDNETLSQYAERLGLRRSRMAESANGNGHNGNGHL